MKNCNLVLLLHTLTVFLFAHTGFAETTQVAGSVKDVQFSQNNATIWLSKDSESSCSASRFLIDLKNKKFSSRTLSLIDLARVAERQVELTVSSGCQEGSSEARVSEVKVLTDGGGKYLTEGARVAYTPKPPKPQLIFKKATGLASLRSACPGNTRPIKCVSGALRTQAAIDAGIRFVWKTYRKPSNLGNVLTLDTIYRAHSKYVFCHSDRDKKGYSGHDRMVGVLCAESGRPMKIEERERPPYNER